MTKYEPKGLRIVKKSWRLLAEGKSDLSMYNDINLLKNIIFILLKIKLITFLLCL